MAEAVKKKVISVGYILTDGKVIDQKTLMRAERIPKGIKAGETEEIKDKGKKGPEDFVEPPFNFFELSALLERSTPHYRAVKAKAGDSVLGGWFLEAREKDMVASEVNRRKAEDFLNFPSKSGQNLESILENFVIDFESLGNGGLEIVADPSKTILELNHIPFKTCRTSRDQKRIRHQRGNIKRFFKLVGVEEKIDKLTGEFKDDIDFTLEGNSFIHWKKYHPKSDFYGIPDIIPGMRSLLGDLHQKQFNLDFFENGAIPDYLIIIEGAELDDGLRKLIEDFFAHEMKGAGNTHKTMILPIPIEGVTVKLERITPEISDGSFKIYHEQNVDEILSADGVPHLRAFMMKPGSFGRDQSREVNKVYKTSIIKPLQRSIEGVINKWVLREGLGITDWVFRLQPLEFDDRELASLAAERITKTNAISVNEMRRFLAPMIPGGLDPVDGGDFVTIDVAGTPTPIGDVFENEKAHGHKGACIGWKALFDPEAEIAGPSLAEWDGAKQDNIRDVIRVLNPIVERMRGKLEKEFAAAEKAIIRNLEREAGGKIAIMLGYDRKQISVIGVLRDFRGNELAIEEIMIKEGSVAYQSGVALAAQKTGVDISFSLFRPAVAQYLEETVKPFSEKISAGISNRIRRQLSEGIAAGEDLFELRERVIRTFKGVKEKRALLIARTEAARAHNIGTVAGYDQSGVVKEVEVSDGFDFDAACEIANGSRWSLQEAKRNPIEHPNCVRAFIPITIRPGERRR